ncbi:MAG TPA: 2OG-Fe(II) oxygenase [Pyrinomonadaceae bacterium]|nr:2OG-Fe(II) oxygenase [Pyrinomonadaceae bacterium]
MTARFKTPPGIYSLEGFLDRPTCELVKSEMRAGEHARARVYDREWNYLERAALRSTLQVEVNDSVNALVRTKLLDVRAPLGRHFGVELSDCQCPTYLIYKPGDFFEPHKDESQRPGAPGHVRARRVSAILFLSDEGEGDRPGEYAGGSLGFYGLLPDPRCAHIGLPLKGRAGLLVAFRSDVFHQVTPVTRGERYTVVSWYV